MLNLTRYAGVNTKVKALFGKMLQKEDYQNMLEEDSVQGIFTYLANNTYYQRYLSQLADFEEIHRRQLERTLKKIFINDFYDIRLYLGGSERDFFDHLFTKFEMEELKMILRTILIEHDRGYLEKNLVYLDERKGFDVGELVGINNYHALLDVFRETWFFDVLKKFEDRYKSEKNLFPIETSLDLKYFSLLKSLSERLHKKDKEMVQELFGVKVDLLNINWIYRAKKYFELEPEEIINYLIPYSYYFSNSTLREMSRLNSPEEVINFLVNTRYYNVFLPLKADDDILFEKYCFSYILKQARKNKRRSSFNLGLINSYFIMKEYEIQDIITIVEGVRYSLGRSEISKFLIRNEVR